MLDATPAEDQDFALSPLPDGYASKVHSAVTKAIAFDMRHILARYRREHMLPDAVISDHHRELMRFLALCSVGLRYGRSYGMMGAIDELWHCFVIFTREYGQFCDAVAGQFMHHVPVASDPKPGAKMASYVMFLTDYAAVFGEDPPVVYWPVPRRGHPEHIASCGVDDDPSCGVGCSVGCGCGSGPVAEA